MKKLLNKKGFTLMEMMIVIAIIVILVAISIPAMSGSLEKAHRAADAANLRAAKAAYLTQSMLGSDDADALNDSKSYYYDIKEGKFVEGAKAEATAAKSLGSCKNHDDSYITIDFSAKEVKWSGTYSYNCDTTDVPESETGSGI